MLGGCRFLGGRARRLGRGRCCRLFLGVGSVSVFGGDLVRLWLILISTVDEVHLICLFFLGDVLFF